MLTFTPTPPPPPVRQKRSPRGFFADTKKNRCYLIIFRIAYKKIQNVLNRTILILKIYLNLQRSLCLKQTGPNEYISQNLNSKYVYIFTFQNILQIFLFKKTSLVADRGLTPPPCLRTCPLLLGFFTTSLIETLPI